ncbi:MAG: hypothetical protein WCQ03_10245, partial [Phycisphaerae bacterium]
RLLDQRQTERMLLFLTCASSVTARRKNRQHEMNAQFAAKTRDTLAHHFARNTARGTVKKAREQGCATSIAVS